MCTIGFLFTGAYKQNTRQSQLEHLRAVLDGKQDRIAPYIQGECLLLLEQRCGLVLVSGLVAMW